MIYCKVYDTVTKKMYVDYSMIFVNSMCEALQTHEHQRQRVTFLSHLTQPPNSPRLCARISTAPFFSGYSQQ